MYTEFIIKLGSHVLKNHLFVLYSSLPLLFTCSHITHIDQALIMGIKREYASTIS